MRKFFAFCSILSLTSVSQAQNRDSLVVKQLFDEVLTKGECYENLRVLCKTVGNRLSGSPEAAKAVKWGEATMRKAGFDSVYLQPVMVPHWVRGEKEQAQIITSAGKRINVHVLALGGSVATTAKGITAEIIEVSTLEEAKALKPEQVKGKIVFFNRPMNPKYFSTFQAYGDCVDQRARGAVSAAPNGAVAVLVRSMTLASDHSPHTGSTYYDPEKPKIPAAGIATLDADLLSKLLKEDPKVKVFLKMNCSMKDSVLSYNVIGELKGSQFPNEILTVGGHLDSWDIGEGAHDDGAGCAQSLEAVRLIKALGLRPKRTIRVVLFMNEENGNRGGETYALMARVNKENIIFAVESDAGGNTPRYLGLEMKTPAIQEKAKMWVNYFIPYGVSEIRAGGGGVDIGPLKQNGTVLASYLPDSQRYFDYHHSENDVFENIHKRELELGAGHLAAILWLVSEYGI